jgi:uncharacterized protein YllA (UPF0747 family)
MPLRLSVTNLNRNLDKTLSQKKKKLDKQVIIGIKFERNEIAAKAKDDQLTSNEYN